MRRVVLPSRSGGAYACTPTSAGGPEGADVSGERPDPSVTFPLPPMRNVSPSYGQSYVCA